MIHDQLLEHLQSDDIRQRLLLEPDLTLQKATGLAIQLESATENGCLQAQARLSNASAAATFFVVDKGTALLGMDLISTLKLQINGDKV